MTDVRRLVARLNPATPNLHGSGGLPEWTQQDIAAALGMLWRKEGDDLIRLDDMAREVFCACWAPDFARLTRDRLLQMIGVRQFQQLTRQRYELETRRLEVVIAHDAIATEGPNASNEADLRIARNRLQDLESVSWTIKAPEMFCAVRKAAMAEICAPNTCRDCGGRARVIVANLVVKCGKCEGRGIRPVSERQRAAWIGRDESNFRREWRPLYDWTFRLVADAETAAVAALRRALEIDQPEAA